MDFREKINAAGAAGGKPLNAPRRTMRPLRALSWLLLRTALWTALSAASCVYYFKEAGVPKFSPEPAAAVARALPAGPAPYAAPVDEPPAADSLALIKDSQSGRAAGAKARGKRQVKTRLRMNPAAFGSSGGNFAPMGPRLERSVSKAPDDTVNARYAEDGDIVLPAAALTKKVKLKGSAPVPAAVEKKYTGTDREGELLRAKKEMEVEAAAAAKRQLRREQLILAGLVLVGGSLVILIGSRIVKAVRLLHKPEGAHWTLK